MRKDKEGKVKNMARKDEEKSKKIREKGHKDWEESRTEGKKHGHSVKEKAAWNKVWKYKYYHIFQTIIRPFCYSLAGLASCSQERLTYVFFSVHDTFFY